MNDSLLSALLHTLVVYSIIQTQSACRDGVQSQHNLMFHRPPDVFTLFNRYCLFLFGQNFKMLHSPRASERD